MIAYVKGELVAVEETSVIIDNQGMGFRVFTPIREDLLRIGVGSQIKLHTYMNVREDAMILFGFLQPEALALFKQLINVNGVGPKYALAILTAMSVDQVILAIASEDKKALTKVAGIGPKTAGRIILDLKDKVSFTSAVILRTCPFPAERWRRAAWGLRQKPLWLWLPWGMRRVKQQLL